MIDTTKMDAVTAKAARHGWKIADWISRGVILVLRRNGSTTFLNVDYRGNVGKNWKK